MRAIESRGFTLIEVLIAMVILAVGLLSLHGLSIIAIRSVANADHSTRAAAAATFYLEDALQQINSGLRPASCTDLVLANGDRVTRTVAIAANGNEPSRVTVQVSPAGRLGLAQPYTVNGYAFTRPPPAANGNACPS